MGITSLSKNENLLVEGPARVEVVSGSIEVFGKTYLDGEQFVVIYGKTYPIQAMADSKLELILGSSSKYEKVDARLIPKDWDDLVGRLMMDDRKIVTILGDVDTGKSGLVLYVTNRLCTKGYKVTIIDADIGQSNIGPPGVIGLSVVDSPLFSLMNAPLIDGYFIGANTPSGHLRDMVLGTKKMVDKAVKVTSHVILVDTTGMVYGEAAKILKEEMNETISPDIIAVLQSGREIEHLVVSLKKNFRIQRLSVPSRIQSRSRRERISLRAFSMRRFMGDRTLVTLDMDRIVLRGTVISTGRVRPEKRHQVATILKGNVVFVEEFPEMILAITNGNFTEQGVNELKEIWNKNVKIVRMKWFNKLVVGLLDKNEHFLNIGFLESLNFQTQQLTLSTSLTNTNDIQYVKLGYLQIDDQGGEVGIREIGKF